MRKNLEALMDEYVEKFNEPVPFGLTLDEDELAAEIEKRIASGKPFVQKNQY